MILQIFTAGALVGAAPAIAPLAAAVTLVVGTALICAAIFRRRSPHRPVETPAATAPTSAPSEIRVTEAPAAEVPLAATHAESSGGRWWWPTVITVAIMIYFCAPWEEIAAVVLVDVIGHSPWASRLWDQICARWPALRPVGELLGRLMHTPLGHEAAKRGVRLLREAYHALRALLRGFGLWPGWT